MKKNNQKFRESFQNGKELIVCSASKKCQPNGIIVISLGLVDGGLLIADCQMERTIRNLKENSNVCVISGYFKIIGKAKIFNKGKYFDLAVKKTDKYKVRNTIFIIPKKLINLDKVKVLDFKL